MDILQISIQLFCIMCGILNSYLVGKKWKILTNPSMIWQYKMMAYSDASRSVICFMIPITVLFNWVIANQDINFISIDTIINIIVSIFISILLTIGLIRYYSNT